MTEFRSYREFRDMYDSRSRPRVHFIDSLDQDLFEEALWELRTEARREFDIESTCEELAPEGVPQLTKGSVSSD